MELRRNMKKDAKTALRWCWGRAVALLLSAAAISLLISLIEGLCLTIFDKGAAAGETPSLAAAVFGNTPLALALTTAAALITLAVQLPFAIGCDGWYYRMVGGERENILSAFKVFSSGRRFGRAIGFRLLLAAKRLLWALLFLLPGAAIIFLSANLGEGRLFSLWSGADYALITGWASVGGIALTVLGALLWLLVIQRYFAARYFLAGGSTVKEAFAGSVRCAKGRHTELLLFELSFIGWWALCFFVLPALFVQPYHSASCAIYARYLMERESRGEGRTQL